MKKPQTTTEKPVTTTKTEQPVAAKTTKAAPKKASTAQPAEKKAKAAAPKIKEEQAKTAVAPEAAPKKPAPTPAAAKKVEPTTPELTITERVGLTAGSIWRYLSQNGATPVSKLVSALTEEEKIIQRSIGWLAQEDQITIETTDRVEIIALKA